MSNSLSYIELDGIVIMSAGNPEWPNSANITIIPDEKGFSLFDVGCGNEGCLQNLMIGLGHQGLSLEDLHTVLLSHAHPDHMGAMGRILEEVQPDVLLHHLDVEAAANPSLLNQRFDVPLARDTFAHLPNQKDMSDFDILTFFSEYGCSLSPLTQVTALGDDATISLGDYQFHVYNTPGHSPGHTALFDEEKRLLFSGDLIGKSPAWYTPSSGGLIGYLKSLDLIKSLNAEQIVPSHGPIIDEPAEAITRIENKLLKRESIILDALDESGQTFFQVLEALFPSEFLHFFPGCGILESHLQKLEADNSIVRSNDRIFLK